MRPGVSEKHAHVSSGDCDLMQAPLDHVSVLFCHRAIEVFNPHVQSSIPRANE